MVFIGVLALAVLAGMLLLGYWLWGKGYAGKVAVLAFVFVIAFNIYTGVYPRESYYKTEFVEVTGMAFPASGRFKFKEASYPHFFGDYTSCALIEVSAQDYQILSSKMPQRRSKLDPLYSGCMDRLTLVLGDAKFLAETSADNPNRDSEYVYWGLVADRPEVVIHHVTW